METSNKELRETIKQWIKDIANKSSSGNLLGDLGVLDGSTNKSHDDEEISDLLKSLGFAIDDFLFLVSYRCHASKLYRWQSKQGSTH
jgi:hypothetical protein